MFFSCGAIMADNQGFTLNTDKLVNRRIRSLWIVLLVIALFLLSGQWGNADPMGDFFKKVGQSISKAFQPQPVRPQTTRPTRASRRPTSRESNAVQASATRVQSRSHQNLLKKRSSLSLCCRRQLRMWKKQ